MIYLPTVHHAGYYHTVSLTPFFNTSLPSREGYEIKQVIGNWKVYGHMSLMIYQPYQDPIQHRQVIT